MADVTIDSRPALTSAEIADRSDIRILVDDLQGTPTTKQLAVSELDNLWISDSVYATIYSASHGLTSGSVGKPIGWRTSGVPYVYDDTSTTEEPVAWLQEVVDTSHITVSTVGPVIELAATLLDSPSSGNRLYWDASAALYKTTAPADRAQTRRVLYYIGEKEGDSSTAVAIIMPWQQDPISATELISYAETAVPTTGAVVGIHSVQTGTNRGLYVWTGTEAILITAYSEDGDWPVS